VIYSGVGPQFSPQATNAAAKTRHELGLPPGKYLLSVSSVEPRKNLKRVLHAWKKTLPELPPDVWLVLAGKKGSAAVFNREEFGTLPDRVLFTGYVPDHCLPGLYAGALAFVFPSLAEGFGFPPLEAMACGTPALTSNTSALPEVCGRAACFVHPWNIEEIAQGIHLLATDPNFRERLRARGLTQVRQFRWDVTAQKTWALLEQEMCAAKEVLPS
jgi:glycosyltransferase involved in cell wall biosynthesis